MRFFSKGLLVMASLLLSMTLFAKDVPGGGDTAPTPTPSPSTVTVACACTDTFDECFARAGTATLARLTISDNNEPTLIREATRSPVTPTTPGNPLYENYTYLRANGNGNFQSQCDGTNTPLLCVVNGFTCTSAVLTYSTN